MTVIALCRPPWRTPCGSVWVLWWSRWMPTRPGRALCEGSRRVPRESSQIPTWIGRGWRRWGSTFRWGLGWCGVSGREKIESSFWLWWVWYVWCSEGRLLKSCGGQCARLPEGCSVPRGCSAGSAAGFPRSHCVEPWRKSLWQLHQCIGSSRGSGSDPEGNWMFRRVLGCQRGARKKYLTVFSNFFWGVRCFEADKSPAPTAFHSPWTPFLGP